MWNKLCPPDRAGKRTFEKSMMPRLAKLGIHKCDPADLTPQATDPPEISPRYRRDIDEMAARHTQV